MKYMILLYGDPAVEPAYGTPGFAKMMAEFGGSVQSWWQTAFSTRARACKVLKQPHPCESGAARLKPWMARLPPPKNISAATM